MSGLLLAWFALALPAPHESAVQDPVATAPPPPTNVLFLLSDDQRYDTFGALGNAAIRTPNLDALIERGTVLERIYCMGSNSGAVCAPSRAMLLSGRSLWRFPDYPDPAPDAIFFGGMADHFATPVHPFDPAGVFPKEARHAAEPFSSTAFADAAVGFLERRQAADPPFFLFVSFTAPHDPRTPPEGFADRYVPQDLPLPASFLPEHPFDNGELRIRDEKLAPWPRTPEDVCEHLAAYYGMISHLDQQVGRIFAALEQSGELEHTLVVYAADHGLAIGSHGLLGKQNLYEHSMRTTAILAGPGVPAGRRSTALGYLHDLYPTVCELAGLPLPRGLEARSLAPVVRGESEDGRPAIVTA
ncbi:MAG TPA: sulfatase-like hydrolase/transferase [Planctomycetota bacterium]